MALGQPKIEYKSNSEILKMRRAGLVLAEALDEAVAMARPGVRTEELNQAFGKVLERHNATSNFLGYHGFPANICASVNHEVVHGFPSDYVLKDGDVLKIDGGAIIDGWHSDSARTVLVGENIDPADQRLSDITEQAMWAGIAALANARFIGQIGQAVDEFVTSQPGAELGILEDYCGHGIGSQMHMAPDVLNYNSGHRGPRVKPGMCLAIEPMLVRGGIETSVLEDDWTVVTNDKSNASQWEHTVAVHMGGIWVLTAHDGGAAGLAPFGVTPSPIQG
ncbi:type I methionyl aminopeptidase [Glutamicibacter arilaitensis]|uniref:Methionine aminopeptidase n=1 Tax=Glutamicibacter arilaitensis (strain DSM 16368 / CIP 108037 / IAM 15318 / JCM 13566 / NCIMB 14258 / Re117) TaxID=861360 RepID=A0ABM9PZ31_GLUAR|nr:MULTISPECIES: type I methionyl aminopeptidase [Glutamicibacter]CBT76546.1 methionyl aminopeptidase [Glutamicibacter arilaitensis Re117]HCH47097.1 type I methionyl aminopeptidase [Glutamicibacter sp.]HCJ54547.1 type I methionyl aminopeptidase [Glutamicibacter sp.]